MIVSASRRTDIPAFQADWFRERLLAGAVSVANPMNPRQIRTVLLDRVSVDAFVFWTKNPQPFFPVLDILDEAGFPYLFHYTINDYPQQIEPAVPPLEKRLDTLRQLARRIGPDRIIWRYDPIVYLPGLGETEHLERFARLSQAVCGLSDTCIFSFYTPYRKSVGRMQAVSCRVPDQTDQEHLLEGMVKRAQMAGLTLQSCCGAYDWQVPGIRPASCIDAGRISRLTGKSVPARKDSGQRPGCGCIRSVDIGTYHTCRHGCLYCYACR